MGILGYWKAFWSVVPFRFFSEKTQRKIIEKRKRDIVEFARTNSKYYGRIIPENWQSFDDIPASNKKDLLSNFNDFSTDPAVTLDAVMEQINKIPKNGSLFGKYIIALTSGSTGNPLIAVQDEDFTNTDSVASFFRGIKTGLPIATITSINSFSTSAERVRRNKKSSKIVNKMVSNIDSTEPPLIVAKKLEKMQPKTLVGYSSAILLIANAVLENNIRIRAKRVFLSGEAFSKNDKNRIQAAFPMACVSGIYGCTEGGAMAYECKYGHMHINSDLVLLEAVDKDFKTVPYDTPSDQTLLTCYFNHIQPLIRFVLGDRITLHHGCPCGCHDDWVEIEGRADDLLPFKSGDKIVYCSPMNILTIINCFNDKGVNNFREYQVVLHNGNELEIRLDCFDPEKKEEYFPPIAEALRDYFHTLGIDGVRIYLSDILPQETTASGKRKRIYMA